MYDEYHDDVLGFGSLFDEPEPQNNAPASIIPPVKTIPIHDKQALARKKRLLEEKLLYDVIFEVQGEEIYAHRTLLACASDYFLNMFISGMKEAQNMRVKVAEVQPKVFKAIIEYIYTGEIPEDEGLIQQLLMLSDEYLLHKLKEDCEEYFVKNLKKEKMIQLLLIADMVEAEKLKKKCMQQILQNIPPVEMCSHKEMVELPKQLILELLQHSLSAP